MSAITLPGVSLSRAIDLDRASLRRKLRSIINQVTAGLGSRKLLVLSDSTQAGRGAGTGTPTGSIGARAKCPSAFLAARLTAIGIPARADAFFGNQSVLSGSTADYTSYNPAVVFGANWSAFQDVKDLSGSYWTISSPNTNALTFTPEQNANRFDVLYTQSSGRATVTVTDTGGTLATINSAGADAVVSQTATRTTADRTAISLQRNGTGGGFVLGGIMPWNSGLSELQILNAGRVGAKASELIDSSAFYYAPGMIAAIAPHICYIEFGLNEVAGGVSLSTYIASLSSLIDICVATGAVVLLATPAPAKADSGYNPPRSWIDAVVSLSVTKNVLLVDHNTRLVSHAVATADYHSDGIHMVGSGYALKAETLLGTLVG